MLRNNLTIEFHVPDFEKAKNFYLAMGFKVKFEPPAGEKPGYLTLALGNTFINFYGGNQTVYNQPYFGWFPKITPKGYDVEIVIEEDQIEKFYRKVEGTLQKYIVQPLEKKPWGKRDFRLVDPFGYYLRFTEPVDWY